MTNPQPGDGSAPCLICKGTGVIAVITTPNGQFNTYCKCPAGQPQNPPPPLPPTPPTEDLFRE